MPNDTSQQPLLLLLLQFPQIPHYNLQAATAAVKPILGPYYREPEPSNGPFPMHLVKILQRSFFSDRFVPDHGDVVFYTSPDQQQQQEKKKLTSKAP